LKREFVFLFFVWIIALSSLIGVHFLLQHRKSLVASSDEIDALISSLNESTKNDLAYFEAGIVKLSDDKYHFLGKGYEIEESNLIKQQKTSLKKITFPPNDPILLQRRILSTEAFRLLNNAEKKCVADKNGGFLFRNGDFYLYYDPGIYENNVKKYGKDCVSCDEIKNKGKKQKLLKGGLK